MPTIVGGPVRNREDWERLKAERLRPTLEGRLPANWSQLVAEYKNRDYPLGLGQTHGFFGTPRYLMGVEELLTKYCDDPEMMKDMNHYLADFWIALFDGVLRDVKVDTVFIWEDMCYRGRAPHFSRHVPGVHPPWLPETDLIFERPRGKPRPGGL